ncbi:hypothetical protein J32TS6_29030 [Virgibacillus pantothenticus]|uniref:hybrid sensor histidine kinase/response regulator n=1 Tax=Virgibacillus pantothenticus TaxID=1473 RepID=UPI001B25537A|nr:ATP-binding protein [Virgibacillus pantothenticus]MBU8566715.1 response regulator [Virgibacillus pantothenticus]MBU8600298.1 response regulator [Virgibacillus pantothenticus]MBU8634871.1 response regulator [Virgibacillus pantothenticus]MBU8642435.1 response regulator [Virgibacillus pantothenticus]MBU8646583.1 response regulator [Virgibacillus pantothenticus]
MPITKTKIFLLISLFSLLLILFRIGWMNYHQPPEKPTAEAGVIDFRSLNMSKNEIYKLDGEWHFDPYKFIEPSTMTKSKQNSKTVRIPQNWKNELDDNRKETASGYGTYRLKIRLPKNRPELLSLHLSKIASSAAIYVDGKLISQVNPSAEQNNKNTEKYGALSVSFTPIKDEAELMIHVSNNELPFNGGITNSIWFGSSAAIHQKASFFATLQVIVSVIYFLHMFYAFSLIFFGKGQHKKTLLYFGIMVASAGFANLIDDNVIVQLPIQIEWYYRILYLLFLTTLICMLFFVKSLFVLRSRIFSYLVFIYGLFCIAIITTPFSYYYVLSGFANAFVIIAVILMFKSIIPLTQRKEYGSIIILLFIVSYAINILAGMLINEKIIAMPYYPFDFIAMTILIALVLLQRYIRLLELNKQQTAILQQANKQKDVFLMNTSHELRNPLHGIINIGQSILDNEGEKLSANNKYHLNLLVRVGQQMSFMLNDLIDLTRLKEERIKLHQKEINLHAVVSGLIDMISFLMDGKKIQVKVRISPSFPNIYADENRLMQILFNILHNAVKFTSEGEVIVKAEPKGKMAYIQVIDTGIGMSEETTKKIFQPYVQENRLKSANGGIGIGLSICKKLIELHGGTIGVHSEINKGSTFFFMIPFADKSAIKKNTYTEVRTFIPDETTIHNDCTLAADSHTNHHRQKILIVDDDPVNLKVLYNVLSADYEVATAFSGEQALQCIQTGKCDLVICDVMMPNMSGYELTQTVRQQYSLSELPILLLTARQQFEDIYAGFLAGANDYVAKPAHTLELRARVRALTDLKKSINEQLKTEAAWLQAQIQPHFLFNTLNTIASLGAMDTSRMVTLLNEFGKYLRLSFGIHNTQTLIPVEDELELTHAYLFIEQERFGDRLQIQWELDENIDFQIPPLSIQPIVENAVKHGVLKRITGGAIMVRITKLDTHFEVSIIDNGVGMKENKIHEILDGSTNKSKGIGLANTNRRFKQLFGKGLMIISEPNEGTTVIMAIPRS